MKTILKYDYLAEDLIEMTIYPKFIHFLSLFDSEGLAFVILSVKDVVSGNWALNDFDEHTDQGTFFTEGKIYGGNVSLNQFRVIENSDNVEEQIKLCDPHLFTPISITGVCGQNVAITVQLNSIKMSRFADDLKDAVICPK